MSDESEGTQPAPPNDAHPHGVDVIDSGSIVEGLRTRPPSTNPDGEVFTGLTLYQGAAWRRLRLTVPLTFINCTFLDDLDLSRSELVSLTFENCRWGGRKSLLARSLSVSGDVRLADVTAYRIDMARSRIGADVALSSVCLRPSVDVIEGRRKPSLDLSELRANNVLIDHLTTSGRVAIPEVQANEISVRSGVIGDDGNNAHVIEESVWLDNSSLTEQATLWMSQINVRNGVHLGPGLVVYGDVRFVDARIGASLRIGVSTNWAVRKEHGTANTPGLLISGGYLNLLRTTVGTRTEIKVQTLASDPTPEQPQPHVILNDATLGDLSLYGLALGSEGGHVCLDGTNYANIAVSESTCVPDDALHHAAGLPELVLVRRYASALEPQQPSPVQTPRTPVRPDAPAAVPASDPALPLPGETMAPVEAHVVGTKARAARPRRLYRAQPYRTLAESLTRAGRASDAKEVLIRMNRDSSTYGTMGWWGRRWSSFSDVTVRFGYSVHRTGIVLAASIILAFGLVYVGQLSDQFMAVDPTLATANVQLAGRSVGPERDAVVAATASSECTPYYPCMQPLVYTLDILVPISDFHQATYWQPKGDWQGRGGLVFLTLLAWASTTVLVSGLSRVARRDHEARSDG